MMSKIKVKRELTIGSAILLVGIIVGFILAGQKGPSMIVVHPWKGSVEAKVKETGYLVSEGNYVWFSPVFTTVSEVSKKNGDFVNKGDFIVSLNDRPLQDQLKRLKGERDDLMAKYRGEAAVAQAEVVLEGVRQAELRLKESEDRYAQEQALANEGASTPVQVEFLGRQIKEAQSHLEQMQANWRQTVALMASKDYGQKLAALDEEQKILEKNIQDMVVRAPFDGVIISNTWTKGGRVALNVPVVQIAGPRIMAVHVSIPREEVWKITVGQGAKLFHRGTYATSSAKVVQVGIQEKPKKSPMVSEQRRVSVVLLVDDPPSQWREGYPLEVEFPWKSGEGLLIPKSALIPMLDGGFVFAVENGKAKKIPVVIGAEGDTEVQILQGLNEGSTILASSQGIQEGMEIK